MLKRGIGIALVATMGGAVVLNLLTIQRWLLEEFTPIYTAPVIKAAKGREKKTQLVSLVPLGTGFVRPTDIQFPPGSTNLAVVLEQGGTAKLLDLSDASANAPAASGAVVFEVPVRSIAELGLLGLAFHPDYPQNGLFYVNYNPAEGEIRTVVSEWRLPLDKLGKTPAVEVRTILSVVQPYQNHNAGQLAFGPDGMLYIALGDGGWRYDPRGHGQNLGTLLGSMLRVDVNAAKGYAVPPDNPFVDREGARPEIWAYGLRNPWRFSFASDGRLLVADVGQNNFEEVNVVQKGDNLGWKTREARHCFDPNEDCATEGLVDPIFEYPRELGLSVTGGYEYTGSRVEILKGAYVFADFTSGHMWALKLPEKREGPMADSQLLGRWPLLISAFGRDAQGELYVADWGRGLVLGVF